MPKVLLFRRPFPLAVSFVLTNRCNYRCPYCYRYKIQSKELETKQIKEMILKLYREGMRFLQITGGEPFLRDDLKEICSYAKSLGIFVGVNTNGSLITPRTEEILAYIDSLGLSVAGPEAINDRYGDRGHSGLHLRPPGRH